MTRRVQACLQMQGGHFFATFVKVIETENSLYLMNEDRCNIYLYDFFSLFLGVQSAPKVGPTSYETACVLHHVYYIIIHIILYNDFNLILYCNETMRYRISHCLFEPFVEQLKLFYFGDAFIFTCLKFLIGPSAIYLGNVLVKQLIK